MNQRIILFVVSFALWMDSHAFNHESVDALKLGVENLVSQRSGIMKAPQNLTEEFITEVEGETIRYSSSGYVYNAMYGYIPTSGLRSDLTFSSDGETVYIPNVLTTAHRENTYIKGKLGRDQDGNRTLSIAANQLAERFDTFDEYMLFATGMTADDYAAEYDTTIEAIMKNVGWSGSMCFYLVPALEDAKTKKLVLQDEYVLTENDKGEFLPKGYDDKNPIYLLTWHYGQPEGQIAVSVNVSLQKITSTACVVPEEGVEWKEFGHVWDAAAFQDGSQLCKIGFKDDKVYIPGLVPDLYEAYAEGTIDEQGIITIDPDPLFILQDSYYYHTIRAYDSSCMFDNSFNLIFANSYPNYKLVYNKETGTIAPLDDMKLVDVYCYNYDVDIYSHKYKLYDENELPMPLKPRDLGLYELEGEKCLAFEIPQVDTDGYWINPEYLYYQCFIDVDTNPYVFTTEKYQYLDSDTTDIPMLFSDGYDFMYNEGKNFVYWYETEWKRFGVRAFYEVDGKRNYTDILWGKNPASSVSEISISDSDADSFDILGRKVGGDYKGIVIKNNKKYIQK